MGWCSGREKTGYRGKQATCGSVAFDADVSDVQLTCVLLMSVKSQWTGGRGTSEMRRSQSCLPCSPLASHCSLPAGLSSRHPYPASYPRQKRGL